MVYLWINLNLALFITICRFFRFGKKVCQNGSKVFRFGMRFRGMYDDALAGACALGLP